MGGPIKTAKSLGAMSSIGGNGGKGSKRVSNDLVRGPNFFSPERTHSFLVRSITLRVRPATRIGSLQIKTPHQGTPRASGAKIAVNINLKEKIILNGEN